MLQKSSFKAHGIHLSFLASSTKILCKSQLISALKLLLFLQSSDILHGTDLFKISQVWGITFKSVQGFSLGPDSESVSNKVSQQRPFFS